MFYKVWVDLSDGSHVIEEIEAENKVSAHHKAYENHKGTYVASVIWEG